MNATGAEAVTAVIHAGGDYAVRQMTAGAGRGLLAMTGAASSQPSAAGSQALWDDNGNLITGIRFGVAGAGLGATFGR